MRLIQLTILLFLLSSSLLLCQGQVTIGDVELKFQSLDYHSVIKFADLLLADKTNLSQNDLINLYVMKGVSQYSIGERESSRKCFDEVLKLDANYELNPVVISPKIITFFNDIKNKYGGGNNLTQQQTPVDSTQNVQYMFPQFDASLYKNSLTRSLILPGWGHLYANQTTKGWILTGASLATAAGMVYYIFDANSKESDYLKASDPVEIQSKYDNYNNSYKIRNTLIISYAVIWIYSQIDLLFFSDDSFIKSGTVNLSLNKNISTRSDINFAFSIAF